MLIRLIITYGAECWTLSQRDKCLLNKFELKILLRVYRALFDRGVERIRYNKELYELFTEPRLSAVIRIRRLQWVGNVHRMDEQQMPK
jgi:hypothetical protein